MITSPQNPRIQRARALLHQRDKRIAEQAFVIEGARLIEEALKAAHPLEYVLASQNITPRGDQLLVNLAARGIPIERVAENVFNRLADTDNPQGVMAVARQTSPTIPPDWDFIVIADELRDPGNLGALLRSAAAAAAQAVILTPGSVDVFAPKVVRAAMGAHFRIAFQQFTWTQIHDLCRTRQRQPARILTTDVNNGIPIWEADLRSPCALVIGSEAAGASPAARSLADEILTIPMPGKFESLNAAVAAGILLFEVVRQRKR
ncbi:MAG: RNA methyltransferase [Chloroflexota bacterium]